MEMQSRKEAVMVDKLLFSFDSFPSIATSVAVFLSLIADSSDAAHADCALPEKNIVLARVVFKEAKLYFISGTRKGAFRMPVRCQRLQAKGLPRSGGRGSNEGDRCGIRLRKI